MKSTPPFHNNPRLLKKLKKDELMTMVAIYRQRLRQAEINKKTAKAKHARALSDANQGRQKGYRYADVMCDIIINNEPDWDSIINGYDSLNYEYHDIKETIEYIYGDSVPIDLPEPCSKHKYYHPDNCYECEEEEEEDEEQ